MTEGPKFNIHHRVEELNAAFGAYPIAPHYADKARQFEHSSLDIHLHQAAIATSSRVSKVDQHHAFIPVIDSLMGTLTRDTQLGISSQDDGTHLTVSYGKQKTDTRVSSLDPNNPTKSILSAQNHMLMVTSTFMHAGIVLPAMMKAGLLGREGNSDVYVGSVLGGFKEGGVLLGMALAALATDRLPTTQDAHNAITREASQIQALTRLNVFPQKVLDILGDFYVNIYTNNPHSLVPSFTFRPEVLGFVERIGKEVFTYSVQNNIGHREPQIVEHISMLLPDNLLPNPDKKNEFIGQIKDLLHTYQAEPGKRQTLTCPARYAGVINPWYNQQKHVLLDWYDTECRRLKKGLV